MFSEFIKPFEEKLVELIVIVNTGWKEEENKEEKFLMIIILVFYTLIHVDISKTNNIFFQLINKITSILKLN